MRLQSAGREGQQGSYAVRKGAWGRVDAGWVWQRMQGFMHSACISCMHQLHATQTCDECDAMQQRPAKSVERHASSGKHNVDTGTFTSWHRMQGWQPEPCCFVTRLPGTKSTPRSQSITS